MRKIVILFLIFFTFTFLFSQGNLDSYVKMKDFTRILIPFLGLEGNLPANISTLPEDKIFKAEVSVLINNGLRMFSTVSSENYLTRGFLAEVVYEILKNYKEINLKPATDQREMIKALSEVNIMKYGDVSDFITLRELIRVLNLPIFLKGVKYFYSFPPYLSSSPKSPVYDPYVFYRVIHYPEKEVSKVIPE